MGRSAFALGLPGAEGESASSRSRFACSSRCGWGKRARPGANLFCRRLRTTARGLQIHDAGDAHSRGEALRDLVDPSKPGWQATLADTFELRRYLFDARLQATTDFHELAFDGRSTGARFRRCIRWRNDFKAGRWRESCC